MTADDLLTRLVEEALSVRYAWGNFRYLFVNSEDRVRVLNATAPEFFAWIQKLAADTVFLGIARLVDHASVARRANASLEQLLESTQWRVLDPARWQHYEQELARVRLECAACTNYRHKRLGHLDLAVAMKAVPIPSVTAKDVDGAIQAIEQFLGCVHRELKPNSEQSFELLNAEMHVARLLSRLTNRASQRRGDAISTIVRTDDSAGAILSCAFCGQRSSLYLGEAEEPDARVLKRCHFDKCDGVIGIETVIVDLKSTDGIVQSRTFDLTEAD